MTPEEAQEHLATIRRVVDRSRAERARSGDIYVVWGVIVVLCDALTLGAAWMDVDYGWVSWPILGVAGAVWTAYTAYTRDLSRKTYGTRVEGAVWQATGVAIFLLLTGGMTSGALPLTAIVPLVSALVAVAMVTSGAVYSTPLLTWSGWGMMATAAITLPLDWMAQYAIYGVAMVAFYIVPGVRLMRSERDAG